MELLIQKIHYNKLKGHYFLKFLLSVVSFFYYVGISFKNFLYNVGILRETKIIGAKVICVGNLTTGGVGKTPVVIELANYLAEKYKVAVISRGYRGKLNNKNVNLIKNYDKILIDDAVLSGDEPNLIAKNTKNCAVITCSDRLKAAKYATDKLGAQFIISDDGFSNRKIRKDLTLLLVDFENKFGNGCVLPYGALREPKCELKRADKILTVAKGDVRADINFVADYFYNLKTGEKITPNNQAAVAFCGVGQPEKFYRYLDNYFNIAKTFDFNDHHKYNKNEIEELFKTAEILVTTEKDAVKIKDFNFDNIFVLKLKTNLNVEELLKNV